MKSKTTPYVSMWVLAWKPASICLLTSCLWLADSSAQEFRTFTSNDGTELKARILSCEIGKSVKLERWDGRIFKNVPWSRFSAEDQNYLKKWVDAENEKVNHANLVKDARLTIQVHKGIDDDFNEYGDIDDRVVHFEPEVIIESDELYRTFTNVRGILVIVGNGYLKKQEYAILTQQEFALTIPPQEKIRWSGRQFTCAYDPDFGGFEYAGYVLVLKNRSGDIVFRKGSRSIWEKNAENLIKAIPNFGYNQDFTEDRRLVNTFGLPE